MNSLEKRRNLFEEGMVMDELKKAIDLIMDFTYFTFEKIIYKQISGLPMGSPLAPILSLIVMVDLEETCIENLASDLRFTKDMWMISSLPYPPTESMKHSTLLILIIKSYNLQ